MTTTDRTSKTVDDPVRAYKAPVLVATTANVTLAGLQTIDDVTIIAGDRVLVKDQTTVAENGVYTAETGNWNRSADANSNTEWAEGTQIAVAEGATQAHTVWMQTEPGPFTLGTTDLVFDSVAVTGDPTTATNSNTTYYVSTTGSDSNNDGLTALTPFRTIQHAVNVVSSTLVLLASASGDLQIIIQLANGTYAESLTLGAYLGATNAISNGFNPGINIRGNDSDPTLVVIKPTAYTFAVVDQTSGIWSMSYLTLDATTALNSRCIYLNSNAIMYTAGLIFRFSTTGGTPLEIDCESQLGFTFNIFAADTTNENVYFYTSGATLRSIFTVQARSMILAGEGGRIFHIQDSPVFSSGFIQARGHASLVFDSSVTITGSATGPRLNLIESSVVSIPAIVLTSLPGNSNGTIDPGSSYNGGFSLDTFYNSTGTVLGVFDTAANLTIGLGIVSQILIESTNSALQEITTSTNWQQTYITYGSNANVGGVAFSKTRNAAPTSHTVVQNADYLAFIAMHGSDGTDFERAGYIAGQVDGTPGNNDMPGRWIIATTPDGSTTPAERMRIDSAGLTTVGGYAPVALATAFGQFNSLTNTHDFYNATYVGYSNFIYAPGFAFAKTRGTSPSSQVTVQNADHLFTIDVFGSDGTDYRWASWIRCDCTAAPSGTNNIACDLLFGTSPSGAGEGSSFVLERFRLDKNGNVIVNTAAIATNATDGFLYIPTCAGPPTGTPTAYTGRVPMIYDTTNDKFWFYNGAWKQAKTPAGAAVVTWQ